MTQESLIVGIDVGGTNSRARVAGLQSAGSAVHNCDDKVGSKEQLGQFIRQTVDESKQHGQLERAVIDFAGPIFDRREVVITNWQRQQTITLDDLRQWGLPEKCLMVNDMEAAAFGLLDMLEREDVADDDCIRLYPVEDVQDLVAGNRILLAPGTGLGTIGIVAVKWNDGTVHDELVPSEVQHGPSSPLDDEHEAIIHWLLEQDRIECWPGWEEFVSGRGLVYLYDALAALRGEADQLPSGADRAKAVATCAVDGSNSVCEAALLYYYRSAAKVAQILGLAFQPYGGIYIAGGSTAENHKFLLRHRDEIVKEVHRNDAQEELLSRFPISIVLKDLNLDGCLWACRNRV